MEIIENEQNNIRILKKRKPDFPLEHPFSSLNKTKFGSIPTKDEKFLISLSSEKAKLKGFISHSERFNLIPDNQTFPGAGTYNLHPQSSSGSYSKLGYLGGFISPKIRFKGHGSYYTNLETPCPGEYDNSKTTNIEYLIKNSLIGKSLFNSKKTRCLKKEVPSPEPCTYSPIKSGNWKSEDKNYIFNFNSYLGRKPLKNEKDKYPSPGQYFPEVVIPNSERRRDKSKMSALSKTDVKLRTENDLHKVSIKTEQDRERDSLEYSLEKQGERDNTKQYNKVLKNERGLEYLHTIAEQSEFSLAKKRYEETLKQFQGKEGNIPKIRFKIEEEKELRYIKQLLGNDNARPDLFYLAAPRWKEKKNVFKVPGPAYYVPKSQHEKYSYNSSKKYFICPKGPEYRRLSTYA